MKLFVIVICLIGIAVVAALLLRRISRQQREAYKQEREVRDERLIQQVVDGMDEDSRREYLKSHGKDMA